MTVTNEKTSIIFLNEASNGSVVVVEKTNDRFVMTTQDAVKACRASDKAVQFSRQFDELMNVLFDWISKRLSLISSASLTVRNDDILFVIVQKKTSYESSLVDDLTDLDIRIANEEPYDLIRMNVLSLPLVSKQSESAFLASGGMFTYNAE